VYTLSVLGIPVYFHYCGGELEKVDFITQSSSCCGDEESDIPEENNGCCKDETLVLQSATDALLKKHERVLNPSSLLLCAILPHFTAPILAPTRIREHKVGFHPALLTQQKLISTFLLRI
jgi:hypothetical protein